MIESIRQWIITICVIIIFITAIQLILPDNSLKKYAKYVLGLLVILVMINPILKIINSTYSMDQYGIKTEDYFKSTTHKDDLAKYKKNNEEKTLKTFKSNLEKKCRDKLKTYYKNDNFQIDISVSINREQYNIVLEGMSIGIGNKGVRTVTPVIIGEKDEPVENNLEDKEKEGHIKKILEKEFALEKDKIKVYQLE